LQQLPRSLHTFVYASKSFTALPDNGYELHHLKIMITGLVEVEVNLRPTVSRPVFLGVGLPSGAHDQIFVFYLTIVGFLMCGTLSDERMSL
jgi:hypothetical protein